MSARRVSSNASSHNLRRTASRMYSLTVNFWRFAAPDLDGEGFERINAIDAETALLVRVAPEWSGEKFYSAQTSVDAVATKRSEHYVTRYIDGTSPRVVKATIPGKCGRHAYSPSLYLNSWRLFQQFLPALDIRVHGILVQPVKGRVCRCRASSRVCIHRRWPSFGPTDRQIY